jgi:NAD-dependent dihydropyrimidine dehydrogenase PreA subunit
MGGQAALGGGRGGGGGRRLGGQGGRGHAGGQGIRQRRRDGSGRGANVGPGGSGDIAKGVTAAVIGPAPEAEVPASAPAIVARARTVAIVAKPGSCIACGTCVETCPRGAITLEETAVIDPQLCNGCGLCVDDCSYGALALAEV